MHFRFFNPEVPVTVTRGHLPHWDQEDATYFITWRTADSIPKALWEEWQIARATWLRGHGIDTTESDWRRKLETLGEPQRREFARTFSRRLESELDAGHGECVLRDSKLAGIVADSLLHFDGDRYAMGDFVIMPNHVHLLVGGLARDAMLKQVKSWKKWAALEINKYLGRRGRLWQDESFDHLVRSEAAFEKFRNYIAENPVRAKLRQGEYIHRRGPEE